MFSPPLCDGEIGRNLQQNSLLPLEKTRIFVIKKQILHNIPQSLEYFSNSIDLKPTADKLSAPKAHTITLVFLLNPFTATSQIFLCFPSIICICLAMADELHTRGSAFSSFSILDKVEELQDNEDYLSWKHEIIKVLRMIELWTFIGQPDKPTVAAKKPALTHGHEKTCNVTRYVVVATSLMKLSIIKKQAKHGNFLNLSSSFAVLVSSTTHFRNWKIRLYITAKALPTM